MEKRTSSVELRLGLSLDWKVNYYTATKYYTDTTKILLLLLYFINGFQKQLNYIVPTSFIKLFITNERVVVNFAYLDTFDNSIFVSKFNRVEEEDLENEILDEDFYLENCEKKLRLFQKKVSNFKIKRNLNRHKNLKRFFIKFSKKNTSNKFMKQLFVLTFKILNSKVYEDNLNDVFSSVLNKQCNINTMNFKQMLAKNPEYLFKNFYEIKEWYKKIGGNLYNFKQNLLLTHFALNYNNCMPLFLNLIQIQMQENLSKQRVLMSTAYNLLFAYTWVQRNIEGMRICFKGTIGNHGRAKSVTFLLGGLYQSSFIRPIEYYFTKIDTKYGSIGMRLWCIFNRV